MTCHGDQDCDFIRQRPGQVEEPGIRNDVPGNVQQECCDRAVQVPLDLLADDKALTSQPGHQSCQTTDDTGDRSDYDDAQSDIDKTAGRGRIVDEGNPAKGPCLRKQEEKARR